MRTYAASAAHPYVSRGGVKLAAALDHFGFDPKGRVCLDVGASTGGFTQVLLERGAKRVYAVDVGRGQLHEACARRREVVSLEETDIRTFSPPGWTDAGFDRRRRQFHLAQAGAAGGARRWRNCRRNWSR